MRKREKIRKWLRSYPVMKKELIARYDDLKDFKENIYNPLKASAFSEIPSKNSNLKDQTLNTVIRIEQQYARFIADKEAEIRKLINEIREIDNIINSLDEYERCICEYRYKQGKRWIDLPNYISYSERQCRNIEKKAIDKIIKMRGI